MNVAGVWKGESQSNEDELARAAGLVLEFAPQF